MNKNSENTGNSFFYQGLKSLMKGLSLTFSHLRRSFQSKRKPMGIDDPDYFNAPEGRTTLQYPHESMPVPDNGRYRLYNEIEDCIVCDLCAKICPVDCIEIDAIKSPEEIGKTSDGTTRRLYAGKFDIDMAKCCYCGLCTTVCPTECLTMTKTYDYSEYDIRNMVYHFSDLSPEEAEQKRKAFEEYTQKKEKEKKERAEKPSGKATPKVKFRPKIKVPPKKAEGPKGSEEEKQELSKPKPKYKPKFKPVKKKNQGKNEGPDHRND